MPNDPNSPPNAPPAAPPDAPAAPAVPAMPPFGTSMPQPPMPAFGAPMGAPAMNPFGPPMGAPAMPGFAPPMQAPPMQAPPMQPPAMPGFAPPMQAAPMQPPAAPARNAAVLGARDGYQFGEESVAQKAQVTLLETPKVAPELPSISKIDPGLEQLKLALEAQMARNAIAPMMYAAPNATRWFRFSPFELFLEQVLARKLWTLE